MLSNIQFETKTIKCGAQSFAVRGFGLATVSALLESDARADIEAAIHDLETAFRCDKAGDAAALANSFIDFASKLPALAASLIAICADEPESAAIVARLPLSVQTEALLAIFALTFDGESALRNFVSGMKSSMRSLTRAVTAAQEAA